MAVMPRSHTLPLLRLATRAGAIIMAAVLAHRRYLTASGLASSEGPYKVDKSGGATWTWSWCASPTLNWTA